MSFDIAVFGADLFGTYIKVYDNIVTASGNDDFFMFMRTHCVLYHPQGKKKLMTVLSEPQEVQYDALLSFLINEKDLDALCSRNLQTKISLYEFGSGCLSYVWLRQHIVFTFGVLFECCVGYAVFDFVTCMS